MSNFFLPFSSPLLLVEESRVGNRRYLSQPHARTSYFCRLQCYKTLLLLMMKKKGSFISGTDNPRRW